MTAELPPAGRPPTGRIDAGGHRFPVRVYYEDTDAEGVVYHANYLHFAERARTEMLRCLGLDHPALAEAEGAFFAVRRLTMDFMAPARLDDALEVVSGVEAMRGASLDIRQRVHLAGRRDGTPPRPLVDIGLTLVLVGLTGRPLRIPDRLRTLFGTALVPAQPLSPATSRP